MENFPDQYRKDAGLIRETAKQISKDLNIRDEIIISENPEIAFDELKNILITIIARLQKENPLQFNVILYRVDISESDMKKNISAGSGRIFHSALAEMIIRREFKKVIIRRYYRDKS
jgi:hypothetical protein